MKRARPIADLRDIVSTIRCPERTSRACPAWSEPLETAEEILAYFDTGASNGLAEAINGRLEHFRGIAFGFRNLTHYILRSLIHSGQLQERIKAL